MPLVIGYFIGKMIAGFVINSIRLIIMILTALVKYILIPICVLVKRIYIEFCDIFDDHFRYRDAPAERI